MAVLLPDGSAKHHQSPQKPFSPTKKPLVSLNVGSQAKKAIRFFTRAIASVLSCYTSADQVNTEAVEELPAEIIYDTELDDMPPEILMKIIGHCDFSAQMHLRATSRRMHSLVEHSDLARRQVVGGVEIGTFSLASVSAVQLPLLGQDEEEEKAARLRQQRLMMPLSASSTNRIIVVFDLSTLPFSLVSSSSADSSEASENAPKILLRRLSKRHGQIVLTMERLKFMMRRLCVCHSLHIRGVPMDDLLATRLLLADYRAVRDLVVDRVSTVSQDNMLKLVKKVCPTQCIYVFNHSTKAATTALTPALILETGTTEFAIEAAIGCRYMHSAFDDSALLQIVIHDKMIRRSIRLPLSQITHSGIVEAARAFQSRCLQLLDEFPVDSPLWEVIVTLPVSPLIDPSRLSIPHEMAPYTRVYFSSMPSVVLEVLINRMNLRVHIDYGVRK
ncbi:hypothetical protein PFISCL1PPCAC_9677 [Pristionchus fissidentatus]|uniref:F-box domain-containing protein n=1 Tax=Pristionchus fissidentatus TaxID=1538716 RepID=A0AAV5VFC0_9BILA|nr:hypothetical protein PFISCL1PPCAC_9677 [Pristionchus fissidentatus]